MMFYCIFWLLACFFAVGSVFLAVDFYYWLVDRCSRYRIGRWKDKGSWIHKYNKVVLKWLPTAPPVQISDNTHLLLWDKITGKFSRGCVQSWQTAGLILGACEYKQNDCRSVINDCSDCFIDGNGEWKTNPTNVDNAMLAYSLLKFSKNKKSIKPSMDYMISLVNENVSEEDGLIIYNSRKNLRYVDTLGLVCPFLVLYAAIYKAPEYANLAYDQIMKFNERGLLEDGYLPVHAYETCSYFPMGVYGWGRGTGWYIIAVLDSFLEMQDSKEKDTLRLQLHEMAGYYTQFQRKDGGYGTFLQDQNTYDSSATAIFAYFYACCGEIFERRDYAHIARNAMHKLKGQTRISGKLDHCQGDTIDVGVFSTRYDVLPFAQGMGLRAFAKLLEISDA